MENPNKIIDDVLKKNKPALGGDYDKYKNHVCRVFLNCLLIDGEKKNEEKYAIASIFHDIGIWTNNTIDYLDPSVEQAKMYLNQTSKQHWIEEVTLMICWHHKITPYQGKHQEIVGNFRKADWIDVSLSLVTFGLDKKKIKESRRKLPNLGFHKFLIKKIVKNLFIHPLNPFPMFKK